MIDKLITLAEMMTNNIDVIGISCGGPLDAKKGVILSPPNLFKWDDVKIVDYITNKCGAKAYLENWQDFTFPGGDNVKEYFSACEKSVFDITDCYKDKNICIIYSHQ